MTKKNDGEQNALIREVWNGVREEKVVNFMKAYWSHIVFGFALLLFVLVGFQWYRRSHVSSQLEESSLYEQVLSPSSLDKETLLKTLTSTGDYGYQGVAVLIQADKAIKDGKTQVAIDLLEKNKNEVVVKEMRHLVVLKLALLKLDKLSYDSLKGLLSPLLNKDESFYATATLLLGVKAMDSNQKEEAMLLFESLVNDSSVPISIRSVAQEMKNAL